MTIWSLSMKCSRLMIVLSTLSSSWSPIRWIASATSITVRQSSRIISSMNWEICSSHTINDLFIHSWTIHSRVRNLNKVTNDVYQQYKGKNSKLHLAHYHRHFDIGASWNFSSSTGSQSWVDGILVSIKYQAIRRTLSDERTTAILKPHELNEVSSKGTTLLVFHLKVKKLFELMLETTVWTYEWMKEKRETSWSMLSWIVSSHSSTSE